MVNIPRILNCAAVKLFAVLDDPRQQYQQRAIKIEPARIAQLAICQAKGDRRVSMFCCDANWKTLHTEYFDSIENAINRAETIYPGSYERWISPSEAANKRHQIGNDRRCSFCGEIGLTPSNCIAGDDASICYDCIQRFYPQTRHLFHKKQAVS